MISIKPESFPVQLADAEIQSNPRYRIAKLLDSGEWNCKPYGSDNLYMLMRQARYLSADCPTNVYAVYDSKLKTLIPLEP